MDDHLKGLKENIVFGLETMKDKYNEEDLTLILFYSLPSSYMTFRGIVRYSSDTLTLQRVYDILLSKDKTNQLITWIDTW